MPETACSCCQGDPLTVCDACGEHSCWAGRFMCENAGAAGTRHASADDLAEAAARRYAARFTEDPGAPGSPAAALVWAVRVLDERGRELERLRTELHARNVDAKTATIQAVGLRARVAELEPIEQRAHDARRGNASETDEYERGWLDAACDILRGGTPDA